MFYIHKINSMFKTPGRFEGEVIICSPNQAGKQKIQNAAEIDKQ